ncbi:MAG: J domain-containing protein [Treponema sp.]|jgi:hypothetical protein|nr:J domain-containing protein [Treponema sp.]
MGIFNRLGDVIKSYLNDEDERIFGPSRRGGGNPDLEEAEAELEEFLRGPRSWGNPETGKRSAGDWGPAENGGRTGSGSGSRTGGDWGPAGGRPGSRTGGDWGPAGGRPGSRTGGGGNRGPAALPPEELRPDFAELGLPFGAAEEECKAAYKKLIKRHHPDRHAGHEGNMKKATEKSARINAAYDRIEKWRGGGK